MPVYIRISPYICPYIYPYKPVCMYDYNPFEELEGGTPSNFAVDILWGLRSPQVPYMFQYKPYLSVYMYISV